MTPFSLFQGNLSSLYSRITLNRITTAFFIFSFVHCFAQGIIQSFLFSIDAEYDAFLSSITTHAGIPSKNFTYREGSSGDYTLFMCNNIPHGQKLYPCFEIFRSTVDEHHPPNPQHQATTLNAFSGHLAISPVRDTSGTDDITGLVISSGSQSIFLDQQCTQTLVYFNQIMHNSKREDLTFVLLQFWLFGISILAIMSDSVPHTLAVLITRSLITAWSAYAIWRTTVIEARYKEIISGVGTPCSFDFFPSYFSLRVSYEVPDLILNITALMIACYLSLHLLRNYSSQSLKRVGAPKHINRINKFFMAVLACLQLECFFLVAAGGLWIDVLVNTYIAEISAHTILYKGLFTATTILLLPWIAMGWYSIRQEMRVTMLIFLGVAFLLLTGWSVMFYSIVYRWTFIQWPYLGVFTVASLILIIASIVLGVICRLNFGKGLAEYLHAEEALASSNFAPEIFSHDEEKGLGASDIKVLPTFESVDDRCSESFYAGPEMPRPTYGSGYKVPYNVPF